MAPSTKSTIVTITDAASLAQAAIILASNGIKALAHGTVVKSSQEELKFPVIIEGSSCRAFLKTIGNDDEGRLEGTAEAILFTSPTSADLFTFAITRSQEQWVTSLTSISQVSSD